MHDDDPPAESPEQSAYVAVALAARAELLVRAELVGAMTVEEIAKWVDATDDVMRFHMKALLWDKRLEMEEARGMPLEHGAW